jgi:hypothetical protein
MRQHIGPGYKSYLDDEGRTDLPAMLADSEGPVFGLVGNPARLTAMNLSYSSGDDGRPTALEIGYGREGQETVRVISPDVREKVGFFERDTTRRFKIFHIAQNLMSSASHSTAFDRSPQSLRLKNGLSADGWSFAVPDVQVVEIGMPDGKCVIGMVGLDQAEVETVLASVRRIDKLPDEAERAKAEMWSNFQKSRSRRRG